MWVVLICIGLVVGDGNERKQKGHSGQMSGGGTAESYIGFGCGYAFWRKEKGGGERIKEEFGLRIFVNDGMIILK